MASGRLADNGNVGGCSRTILRRGAQQPRFQRGIDVNMFTMVRPEHLNHFGNLFGGNMLKWIDEFAYLTAIREFPGEMLVTRAMDNVVFTKDVKAGSVLRFAVQRRHVGHTSVTYAVDVYAQECGAFDEYAVFATSITFVCVDQDHRKRTLPPPYEAPTETASEGDAEFRQGPPDVRRS